jgi:transcriptional regulator with XRE-family HTH domain
MHIGKSIRKYRKLRGITQIEFSKELSLSQTSISQIEKGIHNPSSTNLEKISEILRVPIPVLYWEAIEPKDIPENKREIFDALKPGIDQLIENLVDKV